MKPVSCEWRGDRATSRIPNGRDSGDDLAGVVLGVEPSMVHARREGSKGHTGGTPMLHATTCTLLLCT
jgi:hypothetical protein